MSDLKFINGVYWYPDFRRFRTPDNRVYDVIPEPDGEGCCEYCAMHIPDNMNECCLDTDPAFKDLVCWEGAEDEGITFNYFVLVSDSDE